MSFPGSAGHESVKRKKDCFETERTGDTTVAVEIIEESEISAAIPVFSPASQGMAKTTRAIELILSAPQVGLGPFRDSSVITYSGVQHFSSDYSDAVLAIHDGSVWTTSQAAWDALNISNGFVVQVSANASVFPM